MVSLFPPRTSSFLLLTLLVLSATLAAQGGAGKAPPDAPAQARAETLIRSVFRADFDKARTDLGARKALAITLLEEATKTKDDAALRFVALRQAHDLAAQAGDADTALRALAALSREYAIDTLKMKTDALVLASRAPGAERAVGPLVEGALATAAEAVAADAHAAAEHLLESVGALARKSGRPALAARVAKEAKRIAALRQDFERVRPAVAALRKDPTDAAASLAVGKYRCLVQGKWKEGLPLLARAGDAVWSGLAKKELANPTDAAPQVALADGWWELARQDAGAARDQLRRRAYAWYREALPDLEGPTRARVRQRIDEALDEVPYLILGEIRQLEGHTQPVAAVAFSPDGRFVYSAGWDRLVRRVDVRTGQETGRFEGHTEEVWSVAVSPDGRQVLSGSKDNTVRLWDAATLKPLRLLEGHTDQVRAVAFSPDGRYAISGGEDRTVRLWDLKTGREVHRYPGHTRSVEGVAFAPDGKQFVSAGWDRTVRLWDVASRKELKRFVGHTAGVYRVAFAPDGRQLVSGGGDNLVRLWNVASGKEVSRFEGHTGHVVAVAFASDGQRVLSGGGDDDNTVRLWDVDSAREVQRFTGHAQGVWGVAFSPDGWRAVSCSEDGTVRLWGLPR